MTMIKKVIIVLGCMVCLTGCWDRIELNDISIVSGIAVDKGKKKKYLLTVEAINASQFSKNPGGESAPVATFSLEGDTVSELVHKMNVGMTRQLIFSHTRVLYISEEIAREGMLDFLDFLDRSGQFRNDFNIIVTRGERAETFTRITYPVQKIPSLKIHKQTQSFIKEWGGDPSVRLTDFISSLTSLGKAPVAASIELQGDPEKGMKTSNNLKTSVDTIVVMRGMAVFDDERLLGFLSLEDTRNYYWTQKLRSTTLSIPCGSIEEDSKEDPFSSLRVMITYADLKVDLEEGKPVLKVDITGETRLDATQCREDLTKVDTYSEIEARTNHFVEKQIFTTIQKVQKEFGQDIFGFGDAYNRQHHKEYKKVEKKWNKEFAKAEVRVHTDLHLRRSGVRSSGFLTEIK